jgi:hypothetical protein
MLSSGQQLISVPQNLSIVVDYNARDILNTLGESSSNLSVSSSQTRSQMSRPQPINKKPAKPLCH